MTRCKMKIIIGTTLAVILAGLSSFFIPFQNKSQRVISDTTNNPRTRPEYLRETAPPTGNYEIKDVSTREPMGATAPDNKPFREMYLTDDEVEIFLLKHGRDGPSLIAAFTMLNDLSYLKEAIERFPEVPEVALVALSVGGEGTDALWIKRLQDADPDNALVQFLVSYEALLRQNGDEALDAMQRADHLDRFDDYNEKRMNLIKEAAMDFGYSPEVASAFAAQHSNPADALLPKYLEFAELVSSHLSNYRQNPEQVDWILQAALSLGEKLQAERQGRSVFVQAGAALYQQTLYEGIIESNQFPSQEESPSVLAKQALDYKQQLVDYRQAFNHQNWLSRNDDAAVIEFFNIQKDQGELQALRWALAPVTK
jgi:hypothetical protein